MHKSVLSSREEEPFNLNPEMKSFIPCSTALRPTRLGKQVPLALLSKRPSPLLCCDVNSLNLFTVCMRGNWLEMEEDISVSFFFFWYRREGKSVPESVLRKVSYKEKRCLVPKQKTEEGRTGHKALSPAGLLRSVTSSSSSTAWNVKNPTGLGF